MDFFDDSESLCCETILQNLSITQTMAWKLNHLDVFTIIIQWNNYILDLVSIFLCTKN